MKDNKKCLCIESCVGNNGRVYRKDSYYNIIKTGPRFDFFYCKFLVYYEISSIDGCWMGNMAENDFVKYFCFEYDIISDVDKLFNNIMDG